MISISEIYDKDLNFLIGSGASYGLLPTLQLGLTKEGGGRYTLEELATFFEKGGDRRLIPLFMHYYQSCIRPAEKLSIQSAVATDNGQRVINNYRVFLTTVLEMLKRRKALDRRCNVFTTNYDGCFPLVADKLLQAGHTDFVLNDGARGFTKRVLQARNFGTFLCQTGVFGRHQTSIPQINLIHVHGSVYWSKAHGAIKVSYDLSERSPLLNQEEVDLLQPFSSVLTNEGAMLDTLIDPAFSDGQHETFWSLYEQMPIVNPTKWKFHETVYEEHYYQMLRLLSYELEKSNAVLITFGFSFADEHIYNLLLRSLSNPGLKVFVCCFDKNEHDAMNAKFNSYRNVECLVLDDGVLDFTAFNEKVVVWPETQGTLPADAGPPTDSSPPAAPNEPQPPDTGAPA